LQKIREKNERKISVGKFIINLLEVGLFLMKKLFISRGNQLGVADK
jgi:hypothetical protein